MTTKALSSSRTYQGIVELDRAATTSTALAIGIETITHLAFPNGGIFADLSRQVLNDVVVGKSIEEVFIGASIFGLKFLLSNPPKIKAIKGRIQATTPIDLKSVPDKILKNDRTKN